MTATGRLLFWIALMLLGAALAHVLLAQDPGHVLVRWRGSDYTTTVLNAAWIVLGVALALWLAWTLLAFPFRAWRQHRDARDRARLGEGFEALYQGRYSQARKLLAQAAGDPQAEAAARIGAMEAALARGDEAAARAELDAFGDRHAATRAIARAELALRDGRPTDALVALDVPAAQPLPPRGLALRADALAASGQSAEAYGLLGALRRQQALGDAPLAERELRWAGASLREGDENAFAERWESMPKALKTEPAVVAAYVDRAAALGWHDAAAKALDRARDAHPRHPALLAASAHLAQAQGQWAQAEADWHAALADGGAAADWEALGDAYAARGDDPRARLCYANALRMARGQAITPLVAQPASPFADAPLADEAEFLDDRDDNGLPRLQPRDSRDAL